MAQLSMHSPYGDLTLFDDDKGSIVALEWGWAVEQDHTDILVEAKSQLDLYFDGDLEAFQLSLKPFATPHQKRVWDAMNKIPYGETRTYGEIAKELGSAAQAVGTACGANPIPIIQPCHRVLGAGGKIGGYSGDGGTRTKQALLALEGSCQVFEFY